MLHLLEAFAGKLQFAVRRLLGFLDECMQDHNILANHEAIKGPANA